MATLTLADIDTWNVAAIDCVFSAAIARGVGADDVGHTVGDLMAFAEWQGRAAEAARDSAHRIKIALVEHSASCLSVADAAKRAVAEVAELKCRLAQLRFEAESVCVDIDENSGALTCRACPVTVEQRSRQAAILDSLPAEIARLLDDALRVDGDLARAITLADGAPVLPARDTAAASPADLPAVPVAAAKPGEVKSWWEALTPQQRIDYIADRPESIDRDGIPMDARDAANRIRLPAEIVAAKAEVDATTPLPLLGTEPQVDTFLSAEDSTGGSTSLVTLFQRAAGRYRDLTGIRQALYAPAVDSPSRIPATSERRSLVLLDTQSNPRHVLGALGVGDIDHASRVGVTTGGVSTNASSLPTMTNEATNLRHTTGDILRAARVSDPESVATVAWVGYEPPSGLTDPRARFDFMARDGSARLGGFLSGLAATATNSHHDVTAFGHSYGSLVTSLALQHGAPVHNVVFYGSPGLELTNYQDIHLVGGGRAYYENALADPVQAAPCLGSSQEPRLKRMAVMATCMGILPGEFPEWQLFGRTPDQVPGITQLSTLPGRDPLGLVDQRTGSIGHSQYPQGDGTGNHTTLRMSGYNLAAVLSGVPGAPKTGW